MMARVTRIYILIIKVNNMHRVSIELYILNQVILAFRLVLACDVLEDRRTIDVTITKFILCV